MVFLGAPGTGKTYLCSAVIPYVYGKVRTVRYWNERDLLSRLRKHMDQGGGDYLEALNYLIDDDFIMLDDVGSSGFNEWRKEVIFHAIDNRYESELPTIFTSNLTKKELLEGLGGRAVSRLFAAENVIIEMHDGEDHRQKAVQAS